MYAVIALQGHQYLVKQGDTIVVDSMPNEQGSTVSVDSVLLGFNEGGSEVTVGTPYVKGAVVTATVKEHAQGDKLRVVKFQGKKRYHRTKGFRPQQTVLLIDSVQLHGR